MKKTHVTKYEESTYLSIEYREDEQQEISVMASDDGEVTLCLAAFPIRTTMYITAETAEALADALIRHAAQARDMLSKAESGKPDPLVLECAKPDPLQSAVTQFDSIDCFESSDVAA